MEIEYISNDHDRFAYVEGHVNIALFDKAIKAEGYETEKQPRHDWMREVELPEDKRDDYSSWFDICSQDEKGAFPVTITTL